MRVSSFCTWVVTYRLGVVFGSLHMQQLCGFDELRNDKGIIRNLIAKINTTAGSLYLYSHIFTMCQNNRVFNIIENSKKIGFFWSFAWSL
jgi:hypothetical protein